MLILIFFIILIVEVGRANSRPKIYPKIILQTYPILKFQNNKYKAGKILLFLSPYFREFAGEIKFPIPIMTLIPAYWTSAGKRALCVC